MEGIPTGVVTFLFTDVVGSTRLWAEHRDAMAADLLVHDDVIRRAIEGGNGYVFSTGGDAFVAAFTHAGSAIAAAVAAQQGLASANWSVPGGLQVRMGIHTGSALERGGDYFGPTLNEAARLMSAAHGGQIVLSSRTRDFAPDVETETLGVHRLRDVSEPLEVFQVVTPGLADSFPPLRSLGTGLSTLPEHRSSFVGRRAEIDRVRSSLAGSRLVTLSGVGGVGKTRLAVEAADEELPDRPGGVFFVDLSSVAEPAEMLAAVLSGIGLAPSDPSTQMAELVDFLGERTVLLVVDNCEHLLDAAADVVDDLLQRCPALRVLATSREALDVEGEVVIRVPSLDAGGDGVRLFVDRAMAVNDRLDPEADREAVVELCSRLDGIPLAIELAATATSTASPAELLSGLDDRLTLLRGGRRRGSLGRQRTLGATIDWSHDLLDDQERLVFRRLGVFAGPFIFDLVPKVVDLPAGQAREVLERLVAKSLVMPFRIDQKRTGFRLLETLRVYAAAKLNEADEHDQAAERLVEALLDWVGDRSTHFSVEWTFWRCFRAMIPDVRHVVDMLTDADRVDALVTVLGVATNGSGSVAWDEERLRRLGTIERDHAHGLERIVQADLAGSRAWVLFQAGRFSEWIDRSASGWAEFSDLPVAQKGRLFTSQMIALTLTDPEAGITLADEVLESLGPTEYEHAVGQFGLCVQSNCVACLGDAARATALAEQSLVPQDSQLRDNSLASWLWFSHLAGMDVDADRLALARSADPRDGMWRQSVRIAAALHAGDEADTARELAAVADRGLNGLLAGEEAEYLTAFARLAYLQGDTARARWLLAATPVRSIWNLAAMAHTYAALDDWPPNDWATRVVGLALDRMAPERIEEQTETAPAALNDELARWS